MKKILEWIKPIAWAVVIALFINNFMIVNIIIPTSSMEATLNVGDRGIAWRLAYLMTDPSRNDVVVFDGSDKLLVKRIIGLPKDKIEIIDGQLYINDVIIKESFIKAPMIGNYGPYFVPENHYFMLGDNRNISKDSRYWEDPYIDRKMIKGKMLFKYFPSFKVVGGENGQ